MMGGGGAFLWWIIGTALVMIPMWRLLPKYGINKLWAITVILPVFSIILLWIMAFREDLDGKGR